MESGKCGIQRLNHWHTAYSGYAQLVFKDPYGGERNRPERQKASSHPPIPPLLGHWLVSSIHRGSEKLCARTLETMYPILSKPYTMYLKLETMDSAPYIPCTSIRNLTKKVE